MIARQSERKTFSNGKKWQDGGGTAIGIEHAQFGAAARGNGGGRCGRIEYMEMDRVLFPFSPLTNPYQGLVIIPKENPVLLRRLIMTAYRILLLSMLVFTQVSQTMPGKGDILLTETPEDIVLRPLDDQRDRNTLALEDIKDTLQNKDLRQAALKAIATFPRLTTLRFYSCDLSMLDENDPVPPKVESVVIVGGKTSQGTLRWLAKFPSGNELVFGCDVRGLDIQTGKFSTLTFDNCKLSRSAIAPLVERSFKVTFKEVLLFDDMK